VVYDPEASVDDNAVEMAEAAESVATGEVTQAVRDSSADVGPIATGDWMGLVNGDGIVSVDTTVDAACRSLLNHMLADDRELLMVITGADADPSSTTAMCAWLADQHADLQVEVHDGGQPLYPYLFGVE
jgi:hypothetical protein